MPSKQPAPTRGLEGTQIARRNPAPGRLSRTVMIVEDEPLLRRFLTAALDDAGYDVVQASSAEGAVQILSAGEQEVELLLCDVGLPGESGTSLVARVPTLRPGLPCVLMSAWDKATLVQRNLLPPGMDFLQKPFGVDALLREVQVRLGARLDWRR